VAESAFRRQFVRFAIVGVVSNALLYAAYLMLTLFLGLEHKLSMTLVYVVGVILSFVANRSWSFDHRGMAHTAFVRYAVANVIGYLLNLAILVLAVDRLNLPHEGVQAVAIVLVALCTFLLHRYWVFGTRRIVPNAKRGA
jgi:putative flippase GtrA